MLDAQPAGKFKLRKCTASKTRWHFVVCALLLLGIATCFPQATIAQQFPSTAPQNATTNEAPRYDMAADYAQPVDVTRIETASANVPIDDVHSSQTVIEEFLQPENVNSTLPAMVALGVVSLAPALLLMTTCFVRIIVVLGLLRQALGMQNLPPTQVMTSLALFISLVIMTPVWKQVYDEAIVPYQHKDKTLQQAWQDGVQPVRRFMSLQIEGTGNQDDVWLFLKYVSPTAQPTTYDEVPLAALLPAFMLSELKTAFLIGFQIYIPFIIVDMVVASVTISMGMVMVPPMLLSLPLKLLLFVLVDGWHLIVGMLLESFQPFL